MEDAKGVSAIRPCDWTAALEEEISDVTASRPATVPLTFRIPLPLRETLDRMQQQTGRTGTSLVIEGLRMLDAHLKYESYLAREDYDSRDLAERITGAAQAAE